MDNDYVEVLTPSLETGTILPGITRSSTITLLSKNLHIQVTERNISVDEIIHHHERGSLIEIFGTGTASGVVTVSTIRFEHKDRSIHITAKPTIKPQLASLLSDIQRGKSDLYGWLEEVAEESPLFGKIDRGAMMGWTISHHALRADMNFFIDNSVKLETIQQLKERYRFFYSMHVLHTQVEENVIFPIVSGKLDGYESAKEFEILDKHECLELLLEELKEALDKLQPESTAADLKRLHTKFKILQEIHNHHMEVEEKFVLIAVTKMTKQETVQLLQAIDLAPCPPTVPIGDKDKEYAWMVASLPLLKATIFLSRLPLPVLKKIAPSLQANLPPSSWAHFTSKIPHLVN